MSTRYDGTTIVNVLLTNFALFSITAQCSGTASQHSFHLEISPFVALVRVATAPLFRRWRWRWRTVIEDDFTTVSVYSLHR
jgi:hypothetical protein